jgi:hypothetical protein
LIAFKLGDLVEPTADWGRLLARFPEAIPRGAVRAIAPWGSGQVLYVGADPRPFVADCFRLVLRPRPRPLVKKRKPARRRSRRRTLFDPSKR